MRNIAYIFVIIGFFFVISNSYAYYNLTNINTTIILNANQSSHVVEQFTFYISNASISAYQQNRDAIGLTLTDWQKVLFTSNLQENILGNGHSFYKFEFLPGPLIMVPNGGYATMTMNYYVNNITTIKNIGPRKFEYTFNDNSFNFQQEASGQILPVNTRLNIIIPGGSDVLSVYPLPDVPKPNFIDNYTNQTEFSWYAGEPLSQFSFQYVIIESPETEVLDYFQGVYQKYYELIYALIVIAIIVFALYFYRKNR